EIMLFPNRFFYQDHLCTLPPEADPLARQVSPLALQLPSDASELERQIATRRFLFLPVQGDGNGASDKTNREEAVAIAELIEAFRRVYEFNDRSLDLRQIGIITPYRAQIAQIQEVLSQRGLHFTGLTI
ncbi:MAG: DNA helicase, partial [Saprospiraceae bacterium]|nr:DNA helicase [Saprospiraceae bacterium]